MQAKLIVLAVCVAAVFGSPVAELEEKLRTLLASEGEKELSLKGRGVEVSERGTGSSVTSSQRNTLLQLHNDARNSVQPPAANMPQMVSFKLMMQGTAFSHMPHTVGFKLL